MTNEVKEINTPQKKRKYGKRPDETLTKTSFEIATATNQQTIATHKALLGWRVYATNAPKERLNAEQCVECYWRQYRIEHRFHELQTKVTALSPIFLHKENRIKALVRLLIVALKFSTLIQHQVRTELQKTGQYVNELYPGNPGRKTNQPTTNLILDAFKGFSLVTIELPDGKPFCKITKLSPIQIKLLQLLGLKPEVFYKIEQFIKSG